MSEHDTDAVGTKRSGKPAEAPEGSGQEVRLRMQLRWRDLDTLGHLTHSVYHDFLAEARIAAYTGGRESERDRFVLARVELNHRREVRHEAEYVEVVSRIVSVGTRSITIDHEVLLPDGTVAGDGRSVLVGWDPQRRASRVLTDAERERFFGGSAEA